MADDASWLHDQTQREKWLAFVQSLNPDIDPRAVRLMDELRATARLIHHAGEASVTAAGLSLAQYRILMHLFYAESMGASGDLNPSEISERQRVSRNTVSGLIRSLEEEGLITRRLDPDDRRRFNISLTAAGRTLVREYASQHLQAIDRCFAALAPEEQETLSDLLSRIERQALPTREQGDS